MLKTLAIAILVIMPVAVFGQEQMTSARFHEIVSTPGDSTPLNPKLAAAIGVLFTNATVKITVKYPDGKAVKFDVAETAKTVAGKYIVTTVRSQSNNEQTIDSIMTFDDKASVYKGWATYGDKIIGGVSVYDFDKKIVSTFVDYGDGSSELTVGSYTGSESSDRTVILKNGVLFCTRESKTTPANLLK
jgi:hypothetical protein